MGHASFHGEPLTVTATRYASNHAAYEQLQQGKLVILRKVIIRDGHQGPQEIAVSPEFLSWLIDPKENGGGDAARESSLTGRIIELKPLPK